MAGPDLAEFISENGWETLGVYDAAPIEHHKRLLTTNMLERVNQELKRRSKVFPNPASCLRLFTALLKEWHEDWVYGRKYLDMEKLKEFEDDRSKNKIQLWYEYFTEKKLHNFKKSLCDTNSKI